MTNELWDYYVSYEWIEDGHYDYYDTIFEALAGYYQAINEGPTSGLDGSNLIEVEIGKVLFTGENEEPEPFETHSFEDKQ